MCKMSLQTLLLDLRKCLKLLQLAIVIIDSSTVQPVLSGHSKIDKMKVLKTGGNLMQV